MKKFVYLITDRNRNHVHVGLSSDLLKTMEFYNTMPCLLFDPGQQLNRLVYFEEFNSDEVAQSRFLTINQFTKLQKERLIRSVNTDWIDLSSALRAEQAQLDLWHNHSFANVA